MIICANLWTKNSVEKKAANLRQQAVTTKCSGYIYAEPKAVSLKKLWISVPKKFTSGIRIPPIPQGRHRRINNRNSVASKLHEQPRRGESLFARTGPAGQALSPSS